MTEYIVKNRETNSVLYVGTREACDEQAEQMNTRYQTDAYGVEEYDPSRALSGIRVHFSRDADAWVSTDGSSVCQDHAAIEPCPYPHGKAKR